MAVVTTEVAFYSSGTRCSAALWRDDSHGAQPTPGIVLCNGFRGVKEWILPGFAEIFAANGYTVLTFDHRGFGSSEGERGRIVPYEQIEDIRNAVTFMQTRNEVDRDAVALWGTSFGGANAVAAAALDDRVRAVVCQVGFGDWARAMRQSMPNGRYDEVMQACRQDRETRVLTGVSKPVSPDWILDNQQSARAMAAVVEQFPQALVDFPLEAIERTFEFVPEWYVPDISPRPVMFIGASVDKVVPIAETHALYEAAREPKELRVLDFDHYELYSSPAREEAAEVALGFLRRHMCVT